jgi:hypothetical protein
MQIVSMAIYWNRGLITRNEITEKVGSKETSE